MDIRVPQLAEGVTQATVVSVSVKPGDRVQKDQTILELETNKAVAAIPSPAEGVITGVVAVVGAQVAVGQVLCTLEGSEASSQPSPVQTSAPSQLQTAVPVQAPVSTPAASGHFQYTSPTGTPPPASPSVRKMARELGIDLTRVRGSEAVGRVTVQDLRQYILNLQQNCGGASQPQKPAPVSIDFSKWGSVSKKPMSATRRAISEAMTQSWTTIPHVTQFDDLDMTEVIKQRKALEADFKKQGAHLTLLPFIVKAVVEALKKYPAFNSSLDEVTGEIVYKDYYHIGIAVDTEHGLMVPVIRNADQKSLLELAKEIEQLAEKARSRKIQIDEMQGGTFTISNQGGIGGRHFTPIINKPEAAILGVGRGGLAQVMTKTGVETRTLMPIGLSYDHRVIDGALAAKFVVFLSEMMQSADGLIS